MVGFSGTTEAGDVAAGNSEYLLERILDLIPILYFQPKGLKDNDLPE